MKKQNSEVLPSSSTCEPNTSDIKSVNLIIYFSIEKRFHIFSHYFLKIMMKFK